MESLRHKSNRIIGLDFGSKTVGVAVSDPLLMTATGLEIIRRDKPKKLRRTLARIEEIAKEYDADYFVMGYPLNMDGSEGERVELTKEFGQMLKQRTGLEIVYVDERLTTVEADEIMNATNVKDHKKYVDELAAMIILQDHLNSLAKDK